MSHNKKSGVFLVSSAAVSRKQLIEGSFVQIQLGDGRHAYARKTVHHCFAFYDLATCGELSLEEIAALPIAFTVPVASDAPRAGEWKVVGHAPLEEEEQIPPTFFLQNDLCPEEFHLDLGGILIPANREDCQALERSRLWDAVQLLSRLEDHFAGLPNYWVELQKPDALRIDRAPAFTAELLAARERFEELENRTRRMLFA